MRFLTDGFLKHFRPRGDDEFVDRLNYYYTPSLLLLAAALVSGKQYVAKPIQCWVPPQFTKSMEEYIESYCWIQNTYWLPAHEHIPDDYEARESRQIGYYQWVPFILLLQSFLFTLPCMWWRVTNRRSGLDLHQLVSASEDVHTITDRLEKSKLYTCIAQSLSDILDLQTGFASCCFLPDPHRPSSNNSLRRSCLLWPWCCSAVRWRRSGYYLTTSYLITKALYTANAIGQFFLMNSFLRSDSTYHLYGLRVIMDVWAGREWTRSGHFPRVTLCDFEVRTVGNLNRYTVQCALTVNIFNEKVFVFVWIWLCIVASITSFSLIVWFFNLVFRGERLAFVAEYVRVAADSGRLRGGSELYGGGNDSSISYDRFVDRYLRPDGLLALRMISVHAGDVATMEIVRRLWKDYRERCEYESTTTRYHRYHPNGSVVVSNSDMDDCGGGRAAAAASTRETLILDCEGTPPHKAEHNFAGR